MWNLSRIRAIALDLDDTLWPVWPTIERAEGVLQHWLSEHAPATAAWLSDPQRRRAVREQVHAEFPHLAHDLTFLRRESIRRALAAAGDATELAEPAFEVFFAARQQVALYPDALPALQRLSRRFPVVSLSNGNADLRRIGLDAHFVGAVSAREAGCKKPDPRIFHRAAAVAGVPPEAVVHVGDDFELDVLGALGAGMQAVWVARQPAAPMPAAHAAAVPVCADLTELCKTLGIPLD